jgi:hypothetical protein
VSEYDPEASIMRRPWPTRAVAPRKRKILQSLSVLFAAIIMKTSSVTREPVSFQQESAVILIYTRCLDSVVCDNNKQWIVASSFARSEVVQFFLVGTFRDKLCSNNPRTEDDLK